MTGSELIAFSALGREVGESAATLEDGDALREAWDTYAKTLAERPARDDVDRACLALLTAWHGVKAVADLDNSPARAQAFGRMDAAEQAASRLLGLVPLTPEKA